MTADRFYVVGGHQVDRAATRPEWERYDRAVILSVDPRGEDLRTVVEYVSPDDARPEGPSGGVLFKAATKVGDLLYACTATEVMLFSLPSFEVLRYLSHRAFNDVHHVALDSAGRLVIANTGLDMVMITDWDGTSYHQFDVLGGEPWGRFDANTDYRKVPTTKPHLSHPNFTFLLDDELWVTRAEQKDAVCLTNPSEEPFRIERQIVHDGVQLEGKLYFTTVDGHVVVFGAGSRKPELDADLNELCGTREPLGWCRGICVPEPGLVVVGFSRLRPTKFREKVAWAQSRLAPGSALPTLRPAHIAAFDLNRGRLLWEVGVEGHGVHAIFSIHLA
jgi:hypothetical protein